MKNGPVQRSIDRSETQSHYQLKWILHGSSMTRLGKRATDPALGSRPISGAPHDKYAPTTKTSTVVQVFLNSSLRLSFRVTQEQK